MRLQNYKKAVIPKTKITDYLLSLSHRDGCSKAKFFMRFGFLSEQWKFMAQALKYHAAHNEITRTEISYFGMRCVIGGTLLSPDGRNPGIRSVWFVKSGTDIPFFYNRISVERKSKMIQELDSIVLTEDIPNLKLSKGDIGTVVLVHNNGEGYEVEFMTLGGDTITVATLFPLQIRMIREMEIANARTLDLLVA